MPSVHRILSGRHNLTRTASLIASSVRASTAIERVSAQRTGGGRVRLVGAYTGHEAAQVQVEIVNAGGVPRASVPQFVGVGNGTLQVQGVDALAPLQAFTITLADLGTATATAGLDVREVRIRAKTPGDAGNQVRISVQPGLTRTATGKALLGDWSVSTPTQSGAQWDFGALPLSARDELDPASPRIAFGADPQVYRQWRRFKDGEWQFGLSPALQRSVASGTPVYSVSGSYVVTVTDGATTETYGDITLSQPAIVTFYDLLTALAPSALVEVAGVIVADRVVGGQAAIDVPLRTSAWLLSQSGRIKLQDVAVPANAPTQTIVVRCVNADMVGQERWSVQGDVSGTLAMATTGQPYSSAPIAFTVPAQEATAQNNGRWSFKFNPISRAEGVGLPSLCVRPFRFGKNATPRNVTFRYTKRPPADCKCSDMPTPRLALECLGLTNGDAMDLDPEYLARLQTLYQWRKQFHASNWKKFYTAKKDLDFADLITSSFAECLQDLYQSPPAVAGAVTEWDAALAEMKTDLTSLEGLQYTNFAGQNLSASDNIAQYNATTGYVSTITKRVPNTDYVTDVSSPEYLLYEQFSVAINDLVRKYLARLDYCRTLGGIVPKSDPSSTDAGGCWVDHGGDFWWVDTEGYYLPAFTNQGYVSARRNTETGKPYSTQEFGFGLVVACPERLLPGDEVTIRLENVDGTRNYGVGDEVVLQTVAAGPAWLTGGIDGSDEQTWRVAGSATGVLPDYIVPTNGSAAPVYSQAGIDLRIALGGIPFQLGDQFTFSVEAGQYRWRTGEGAWSAAADIPASGAAPLVDGLQLQFDPGAAPSFVAGDAYLYQVHQPGAASHVQDASASAWAWSGSSASMEIDLGAQYDIGAIALARCHLPAGAALTVQLSADGVAWGPAIALDAARAHSVQFMQATTRHVRINVAAADGGSIGWIWVGEPLQTAYSANTAQRRRRWATTRAAGPNAAALYAGRGDGWQLAWEDALRESDANALLAVVDWAQEHDEPLLLVPHHLHPQDAALVRCAADALDIDDVHAYQPNDADRRLLSATLDMEPVYA